MADIAFLRQIGAEFGGLSHDPNVFAAGYRAKAQCVQDAVDELYRLRAVEADLTEKLRDREGFIHQMAEICRGRQIA